MRRILKKSKSSIFILSSFSADEVYDKMEEFLLYFQDKLKNFTDEEYDNYVSMCVLVFNLPSNCHSSVTVHSVL